MYILSASPKSLSDLDTAFGWENAQTSEVDLKDVVKELQGLRISTFAGGSASALLEQKQSGGLSKATSLITTSDTVLGAIEFVRAGASGLTSFSLRSDVRIAATPGYISISGASTSNEQILLIWFDKTGYSAY